MDLDTFKALFRYSDWANLRVLGCAAELSNEQLDRQLEIGSGTLRKTLLHLYNGEFVWRQRWQTEDAVPWPSEDEPAAIPALTDRFKTNFAARDGFLATVTALALTQIRKYRDSRGTWYEAPLGDMLMQAGVHSIHHRAQIVNMLRRLGGEAPELDYMYWRRHPTK